MNDLAPAASAAVADAEADADPDLLAAALRAPATLPTARVIEQEQPGSQASRHTHLPSRPVASSCSAARALRSLEGAAGAL